MIVLDASVLIAYLDAEDAHHAAAERLLTETVDEELGANPLTLAEVLVVPARSNRMREVVDLLEDIEVMGLPFPADASLRLAELRAGTGLKMPDCCVLLSAELENATVASFDDQLVRVAEQRGLSVIGR